MEYRRHRTTFFFFSLRYGYSIRHAGQCRELTTESIASNLCIINIKSYYTVAAFICRTENGRCENEQVKEY